MNARETGGVTRRDLLRLAASIPVLPTVAPSILVVCDGNSLTAGDLLATSQRWPSVLEGLGDWTTVNVAVSGQTTQDMLRDAATEIDSLFVPDAWVVCWEGTNDIYFDATPLTAYNHLVTYCQGRRAVGFKVAIVTILPRNDFPGSSTLPGDKKTNHEARRQDLNTSIRQNWRTFADALVDVAADAVIGEDGDEMDLKYYESDRVHLKAIGAARIADAVHAALHAALHPGGFASVFASVVRGHTAAQLRR